VGVAATLIYVADFLLLGKKRNEFSLFCARLFVTLQAKNEGNEEIFQPPTAARALCRRSRRIVRAQHRKPINEHYENGEYQA